MLQWFPDLHTCCASMVLQYFFLFNFVELFLTKPLPKLEVTFVWTYIVRLVFIYPFNKILIYKTRSYRKMCSYPLELQQLIWDIYPIPFPAIGLTCINILIDGCLVSFLPLKHWKKKNITVQKGKDQFKVK
jgi:hypothetical protein